MMAVELSKEAEMWSTSEFLQVLRGGRDLLQVPRGGRELRQVSLDLLCGGLDPLRTR